MNLSDLKMENKIGILINPNDNVVTLVDEAAPGQVVQYMTPEGPREIALLDAIPFGHKVAVVDISPGEEIVKYDQVIGSASGAIAKGRHVHAHNIQSAVQGVVK